MQGDIIVVLEKSDDGWWRGQLAHEEGWFPGAYTQEISADEVAEFIAELPSRVRYTYSIPLVLT